jgi:hypothetical protein
MDKPEPLHVGPSPDASLASDGIPNRDPATGPSPQADQDPSPGPDFEPDPDWAEYLTWRDRESAAGRDEEPGPEI